MPDPDPPRPPPPAAPERPLSERLPEALRGACLLALGSILLSVPYHLVTVPRVLHRVDAAVGASTVLLAEVAKEAIIVGLTAFIGLAWRERAGTPGLGRLSAVPRRETLLLVAVGVAGGLASVLAYDLDLRAIEPGLYPDTLRQALVLFPRTPYFEEICARMGFLTLFIGLTGRPRASIALHAVAMTLLATHHLWNFLDLAIAPADTLLLRGLALSLLRHVLLGAVYLRHGLVGALMLHAALDLKLFVVALL